MRKTCLLSLGLALLIVAFAWAQDPPPPAALDPTDAMRIENLVLRQQILETEFNRLREQYNGLTQQYEAVVGAAAKKAGVDPAVMQPDVNRKVWVPKPPKPPQGKP